VPRLATVGRDNDPGQQAFTPKPAATAVRCGNAERHLGQRHHAHPYACEGWLYLAVILDLFSRRVIGWSMQARIKKELVLDALLMAVWRRKPTSSVTVHTDQGSQYTSHDWQNFLKAHNLEASLSRRGNCHDNAVAESFFQLLKRERIKRHIYSTRDDARSDIVDYIEMFYNSKRRHGFNDLLSPVEYENRFSERLVSV
jgi:putative transposase